MPCILALLVPKLTEANFDVIMKGIEGRSKREAELFLSTVSLDGEIRPDAPQVEVKILCPQAVYEKLERAKDILAPEGQTWADVLDHALEAFWIRTILCAKLNGRIKERRRQLAGKLRCRRKKLKRLI